MGKLETEIKILNINKENIIKTLDSIGAKKKEESLQQYMYMILHIKLVALLG